MTTATPESMQRYYAQRAAYYERVYDKPERQDDLRVMKAWLATPFEGRRVLEIACGTGYWTPHAAQRCASWLATPARRRLHAGRARRRKLRCRVRRLLVVACGAGARV